MNRLSEVNPRKPKLIYILGSGWSGSTLVDLILGSHTRVTGLGEITHYSRSRADNVMCTCTRPFRECAFWSRVHERMLTEQPDAHEVPIEVIRTPPLWLRSPIAALSPDYVRAYGEANLHLMLSVMAETGTDYVVDSSKGLARLAALHESGLFDLWAVHLVRDGRGYLHSHRKRGYGTGKACAIWRVENRGARRYLRQHGELRSILVRYDDLARSPSEEISRLCAFLGLSLEPPMLQMEKPERHNLGGNPMRIDPNRNHTIKYDDRWTKELTALDRVIFSLISGRLNKRLGFS